MLTFVVIEVPAYSTLYHDCPSILIPYSNLLGYDFTDLSNATNRFALTPELHTLRDPTVQRLGWKISKIDARPDGVLKTIYSINGKIEN